jgi:hypothetical protein
MSPAERVLEVFLALKKYPQDQKRGMKSIWAEVFEVLEVPGDEAAHEDDITDCLSMLRSELVEVRKALIARKCTKSMFEPTFSLFITLAASKLLDQDWRTVHQLMQRQDAEPVLRWAAWALDKTEEPIDVSVLERLRKKVDELEAGAIEPGVSDFMRALTLKHVRLLRRGLRLYKVGGLSAVTDALEAVAGTMSSSGGEVAAELQSGTPESKAQWTRAADIYTDTVRAAEAVDVGNRGKHKDRNPYPRLRDSWISPLTLPAPQGGTQTEDDSPKPDEGMQN